jgi:hypothetical protein
VADDWLKDRSGNHVGVHPLVPVFKNSVGND